MSNSREKIHQSAIQWLEEKSNNYTTIKALKHIPNTKKGETQYEYAYYEEANRGNPVCGRGLVGIKFFEDSNIVSAECDKELLELFPIKKKKNFNKLFKIYKNQEDLEKLNENLLDAIKVLFTESGFTEV